MQLCNQATFGFRVGGRPARSSKANSNRHSTASQMPDGSISACRQKYAIERSCQREGEECTAESLSLLNNALLPASQAAKLLIAAKAKYEGGDKLQALKIYEDVMLEVRTMVPMMRVTRHAEFSVAAAMLTPCVHTRPAESHGAPEAGCALWQHGRPCILR